MKTYRYLWLRLLRRPEFYISLIVGIALTMMHAASLLQYAGDEATEATSVFARWFESMTGSPLPSMFWMIFPLLVVLPMASILVSDSKKNYLYLIQIKGKMRQYLRRVFTFNFLVGGFVGTIPLILNLYVSMMVFPTIVKPNLIVDGDGNITINQYSLTLFPALYYDHPLVHTLMYILIAFLIGGLFASIALGISVWVRSSFVVSISSFVIVYVLQMLAPMASRQMLASIIPTEYANQVGDQRGYNIWLILSSYLILFLIAGFAYFKGGQQYAIREHSKV